jgi:hypothetical protein
VSVLYFGIPVLAHPGRDLVGTGTDPDLFVWALGWWPHAIVHGENPIVTHAVWAPVGVNLAWVTAVPALALTLAPLTLLAGPVVTFNVLAVLLPAFAAFTAYLLCRHLTGRFWPSLAGGYLFGFSSYVLGQSEGHLHMTAVFLVPLVALVVIRRFEGTLSRRAFIVGLGVLLAVQFAIATELWFTVSVVLAVSLLLAVALVPFVRRQLVPVVVELAGAYALMAVLVSPLLVYALLHFQNESLNQPALFPADLLNVVVPTRLTWLHSGWTSRVAADFQGNDAENGAYLGLPLVAVFAWYAWESRRRATAWLLVVLTLLGVFVELGESLHVRGHDYLRLPWAHIATLPGFDNVLPARFSMFVALGTALTVALWAARSSAPRVLRAALVVAAIAFVVPHVWLDAWHVHPERPAFFAQELDRACLANGENVLMLPWPTKDNAMLWQAEAGYRFRMANGYLGPLVPKGVPDAVAAQQFMSGYRPPTAAPLVRFARDQGATTILLDDGWASWLPLFQGGVDLGGMHLYSVGSGGTPCGGAG